MKQKWRTNIRSLQSKVRSLRSERRHLLIASYTDTDAGGVTAKRARIDAIQEILQKLEDQLSDVQLALKVDELLRPKACIRD